MGNRWICLCIGHAIPKQEANENPIEWSKLSFELNFGASSVEVYA
jgi:hypothetical protein